MALNGRLGQRFSQAPQPMQRASFTTGIRGESGFPGSLCTIWIAPAGQWRAQLPHSTPSVLTTQLAAIHTAWPDLHRRLVLLGDRAYGPRGTDLRTLRTFGAAVSPFVGHLGHHQRHQLARRPQHLVGTHGHAQLASGAVRLHITHGERSGRGNGRRTPGDFLLLDHGQAAVDLLLLRPDRRTGHDPDQRKELAARSIGRFPRRNGRLHGRRFHGSGFAAGSGFARKGDRSLAAFPQTVHAGHAAAVIDPVRLRVDARRLAVAGTKAATVTFRGVDTRFENREARHESQDRADRTDRIAIGSAVAPCQHGQHDERHGRHGQRRGRP